MKDTINNSYRWILALSATAILALAGCGNDSSIATVSGKVVSGGKPVEGIRLVFTPEPNEANTDPGPWSTAVTNAAGEFSLVTRHKQKGASIGRHTVAFMFDDVDDMQDMQSELEEAEFANDPQRTSSIKKRIKDFRERKRQRPKVTEDYTEYFQVPQGGTTEANFDLPE